MTYREAGRGDLILIDPAYGGIFHHFGHMWFQQFW